MYSSSPPTCHNWVVPALTDELALWTPGSATPHPADDWLTGPAPQAPEPYMPIPPRYSGDLGTCSQFLRQCNLVFNQQPLTCASPQAKIAFIMSLLSGQAAAWSLAISTQRQELTNDYHLFTNEMRRVFNYPVKGRQAVGQLLDLQQGNLSVSEYAVNFLILAVESGWGDSALRAIFRKGLAGELKDELAVQVECDSLNSLIDLEKGLGNDKRGRGDGFPPVLNPAPRIPAQDVPRSITALTSLNPPRPTSPCNWNGPASPR